jgi:ribosomal protein S18 acetylase RimI-like enzyme
MFVRTAGPGDIEAVRALLLETWHATYDSIHGAETVDRLTGLWHASEALRERLDRPNAEFLIADDGETLGGMAFAASTDDGKTVMLHQLYVRPGLQGRGIGSMLLDEVFESFPDAERIRLEVDAKNARAIAFYVAQGFLEVGKVSNCGSTDSGIPALLMERSTGDAGMAGELV